jgi:alanyl-tRNA synthetase
MTGAEVRQSFLDFFREKQHAIVPSSSLVPDAPNLLFTNAGMNQFVPIFLGQQKPPWQPPRVADTQKCIRAGGKHNDLEDVGLDTYHHTFFEMLGNWSFGDYFKKEAIEWAWELVVERWNFPPQRLYATVYKPGPGEPSEFDQEAYDHWEKLFREADLDPAVHIVNGNKKDNFWMMGDTGPCGPCSELHVDLTPDGDTRGTLVNQDDPRCIEIWNLVFIQFNANADGSFSPLPQRHVDTGLGLERATAIIQGTKNLTEFFGTVSNYETDIFRSIFDELGGLSGKKYQSTLPKQGTAGESDQEKIDIAFRVIADHIRTVTFAIADGIIPSNEGRGYVLRRILRRAVRYGRTLALHEPFFFKLPDVVAKTIGVVFPEVRAKQFVIQEIIKREEDAFNKTLDTGTKIFEEAVRAVDELPLILQDKGLPTEFSASKMSAKDPMTSKEELGTFTRKADGSIEREIAGRVAFKLYDTYGFPLDLTQLMARERGFGVDVAGFDQLMEQQRARARAAQKKQTVLVTQLDPTLETQFVGYEVLETTARLTHLKNVMPRPVVSADRSPFYAAMGGQVADTGMIRVDDSEYPVVDVQKQNQMQLLVLTKPVNLDLDRALGTSIELHVHVPRRRAIERHHTVTHLLHWALHEVVSREASQKGSYVGPDKLTFDFSGAPLTPQQRRDVEKLVNEKIAENAPVSWTEIPYAEAKKCSDIQQFFGDKYGDIVRVVQIGGDADRLNGYSMELCGGTHVRATGEIGWFKILSESAIAAGTRRIEAVAGDQARKWIENEISRQQEQFERLARRKHGMPVLPAIPASAGVGAIIAKIDERTAKLKEIEEEIHQSEKQQAKAAESEMRARAMAIAQDLASLYSEQGFCAVEVPNANGNLLQAVADALRPKIHGPIFLVGSSDGRVDLVAATPKDSGVRANELIQQVAPIVGGKGGGRADSARGAGKEVNKIKDALARARELMAAG